MTYESPDKKRKMNHKKSYRTTINKALFWQLAPKGGWTSLKDFHGQHKDQMDITYNHLTNIIAGKEPLCLRMRKILTEILAIKGCTDKQIKGLFVSLKSKK